MKTPHARGNSEETPYSTFFSRDLPTTLICYTNYFRPFAVIDPTRGHDEVKRLYIAYNHIPLVIKNMLVFVSKLQLNCRPSNRRRMSGAPDGTVVTAGFARRHLATSKHIWGGGLFGHIWARHRSNQVYVLCMHVCTFFGTVWLNLFLITYLQ